MSDPGSTVPVDNDTAGRLVAAVAAYRSDHPPVGVPRVPHSDPWKDGFDIGWRAREAAIEVFAERDAAAVAVPADTAGPHDPAHRMYDADTGVCLDCDRIVDPLAAPVAAAFLAALRAYQDVAEFTEAEDAERVVTAILRAAFRATREGTS